MLGAAGGERDTDREIERGRERGGGDRDGLISTSSSYSSKPASRLQRLGRTRHVPSRAELPVCGQDFPRGPRGPGQSGGTKKTIMQTEEKGVQGRSQTPQTHTAKNTVSYANAPTHHILHE